MIYFIALAIAYIIFDIDIFDLSDDSDWKLKEKSLDFSQEVIYL
jgi:hypothetical protein